MTKGYGSMFNRDENGLTSNLTNSYAAGGVAPTRHALTKQRFFEERCARLDAEATEQKRQKIESLSKKTAAVSSRLLRVIHRTLIAAKLKLGVVSRQA